MGQLLAPKQIELENPATSQIEDSSKAFPTVIKFSIFGLSFGIKQGDPNYGTRPELATALLKYLNAAAAKTPI